MTDNYLPASRSGFVTGKCNSCGRETFSKGNANKHNCKKVKAFKNNPKEAKEN